MKNYSIIIRIKQLGIIIGFNGMKHKKLTKKIISFTLACAICIISAIFPQNKVSAAAYTIAQANTDMTYTDLSTYSDYNSAYRAFTGMSDKSLVIYDASGKVVAMKQGMAITRSTSSTLIFTSTFPGGTQAYCQNNLVAYYNGTDANLTATITISGYTGTCSVSQLLLIPANHVYGLANSNRYEFDYYTRKSSGDLVHYISYYYSSSNTTEFSSIIIDKAPDFMNTGVRYYSTDGYTYYTDPYDATNGVNPIGTHCIYYKNLSYRTQTTYTASELNSFLAYKNSTYWTSRTCAYLGLGSTFLEAQDTYGVNALMEIAFANHESSYGKSDFAIENYNFFGVGAFDYDPSQAEEYTGAQNGIIQHAKWYMNRYYMDAYAYIDSSKGTAYYDVPDKPAGYITGYSGDSRYFGSSPGNKATGINVKYASDPFHGEKVAAMAYEIDKYLGFKDYGLYTIGVTNKVTYAYSEPSTSSWAYYKYSSRDPNRSSGVVSNEPVGMPVVILGESGDFYLIQSEMPVNEDKRALYMWDYNFDISTAYVLKSDIDIIFNGEYESPTGTDTLTSSVYTIDHMNDTISGVPLNTPVSTFTAGFSNGTIKPDTASGNVGTGMTFKVYDSSGNYTSTYTTIVVSDINGDGAMTISDLVLLRRHLAGLSTLSSYQTLSSDINNDTKVTISDLVIFRRNLAGL